MVATTTASASAVSSLATRQSTAGARPASVRAAGLSPITASSGEGTCGSSKTSTMPSEAHMLSARTTSAGASSSPPGGPIRTSLGSPSASALNASRTTIGSEQAPPTQPVSSPSAVTRALSPRLVEAGRTTVTRVARTYGLPSPVRRPAHLRTSPLTPPVHLLKAPVAREYAEQGAFSFLTCPYDPPNLLSFPKQRASD